MSLIYKYIKTQNNRDLINFFHPFINNLHRRRSLDMLKYLSITLLIFMLGFHSICYSQQWVATYHGNFLGDANSTNEAHDLTIGGNFVYITGFVTDTSHNTDMCIIKYNFNGNQIWANTFNGPGNSDDKAYAIIVDNTGAYITGYSTDTNNHADITTIKYDKSSGTTLWISTYQDTLITDSKAYAITVDAAGNLIVTGYATSLGTANKVIIVIKYEGNTGNILWCSKYAGDFNSEANALTVDSNDNVIVTGYTCSSASSGSENYITIKYNSNGIQQWAAIYDGTGEGTDIAKSVVTDSNNNVIVTGYSKGADCGYDYCTIKYSRNSGAQSWVARYDGTGHSDDIANAMVISNDDEIIVTGSSRSGQTEGTEDYLTIRYNDYNGDSVWVNRYNGTGGNSDIAYNLAISYNNRAVYVTGSSRHGIPEMTTDMMTLKYRISSGNFLDSGSYNGTSDLEDVAYAVKVNRQNDVFITGFTMNAGDMMSGSSTMATIKYGAGMLTENDAVIPIAFKLYQNFPNPFNPSTVIKFDVGQPANVKITIFDILGREVTVPVNTALEPGNYQINVNMQNYSSGVYFYELKVNGYREVKKMTLIK
jgi:hypothetical protein